MKEWSQHQHINFAPFFQHAFYNSMSPSIPVLARAGLPRVPVSTLSFPSRRQNHLLLFRARTVPEFRARTHSVHCRGGACAVCSGSVNKNTRVWNVQRVNVQSFRYIRCAYEEVEHETLARALLVTPGQPELLAFACVLQLDEDDEIMKYEKPSGRWIS